MLADRVADTVPADAPLSVVLADGVVTAVPAASPQSVMLANGGDSACLALAPLSVVCADAGSDVVPAYAPLSAVLTDGDTPACLALAPLFGRAHRWSPHSMSCTGACDCCARRCRRRLRPHTHFCSTVRAFLLWLLLLPSPLLLRCCWPCLHVSRCWQLLATAPSFSASASLTANHLVLVLQLRNFLLEHGNVLSAWPALVGL